MSLIKRRYVSPPYIELGIRISGVNLEKRADVTASPRRFVRYTKRPFSRDMVQPED